jgi:beta-galactosidase
MRVLTLAAVFAALLAAPDGRPAAQTTAVPPSVRTVVPLDEGWRFSKSDLGNASMPAFDDAAWRTVTLPHDWSAEGPFTAEWGSGNGYAPGGIGWYRKHFTLAAELSTKVVTVEFDGVYDHSEVWVNGQLACGRPSGFVSFECPVTPFAKFGTADNVIAVRVDHSRFADSRYYTGSGIYRHVRLRVTDPVRIAHWGTFVTTPSVTAARATVHVETTIENGSDRPGSLSLESEVWLGDAVVARVATPVTVAVGGHQTVGQDVEVSAPKRWTLASPTRYTLHQQLRVDGAVVDDPITTFGIRTARFDPNAGFLLNDTPVKLKGLCVHEDFGSLGVAVPIALWESRLEVLKSIGVNAIRTSHNPPNPEFLDLADRYGLLVMDEAFDEFTPAKNKWVNGRNVGVASRFGYAEDFTTWSVTDVSDMVRRDRNHPSVIMWSLGNEVDYPNDPFTHPALGSSYRPANPRAEDLVTLARPLVDAVHALDATRPVTMALASLPMSDAVGLPALLDIVGYNYQESRYAADHAAYPKRVIFGSETNHQFANWTVVRDNAQIAGQFLWTGIDYLGEAGPFPNRANGAGLLDLTGYKKPQAYFRQSLWSDQPMVYAAASLVPSGAAASPGAQRRPGRLEESWNWPAGSTLDVSVYTNLDDVTLTLNDQSLGTKSARDAVDGVLHWIVQYQPGLLRATAHGPAQQSSFELRTAGPASRIDLSANPTFIDPDGQTTVRVDYTIVDAHGVRVPDSNAEVTLDVQGPARVLGIGNADLNDPTSGQGPVHRVYQGRGAMILQATHTGGTINIHASAPGLATGGKVVGVRTSGPPR